MANTDRITNEARRAASIEAVLHAARTLFVEQGYQHTSMAHIAKAAGLTKGAIYFYFNDKADLLLTLLDDADANTFAPIIATVDAMDGTVQEKVVCFANDVAQLGVDHREHLLLLVLMAVEFSGSGTAAEARIKSSYDNLSTMLCAVIEQGQRKGEVDTELDAVNVAVTLLAMVDGLLLHWHRLNELIDGRELALTAREFILRALKT